MEENLGAYEMGAVLTHMGMVLAEAGLWLKAPFKVLLWLKSL